MISLTQLTEIFMHRDLSIQGNQKSKEVLQAFQHYLQLQYNGQLIIQNSWGKTWNFYYRIGQLVWATGGNHPHRRFHRNIAPIDPKGILPNSVDTSIDHWDYCCLQDLSQNHKISQLQINDILINTISELLFDLAQEINISSLNYTYKQKQTILDGPMTSTSANIFLEQMQISWNNWANAGLAKISPDLAPILKQPEELRQKVNPSVFKNFEKLINGEHTLSDLAVKMQQSVLQVTRSLLPFIHQGITELIEVSDLPLISNSMRNKDNFRLTYDRSRVPLIACVDDSFQICQIMEQIVIEKSMKFIGIQESWEALPILIQSQPDLIFLDLVMLPVNGFELCAQLRRVSIFANTPIIILTGNNAAFDQVRSKVFGATDFMTKPVIKQEVMRVINKYLQINSPVENVYNYLAICH